MRLDTKLILKSIKLDREKISSFEKYPFNIEVIKNFDCLELESPVTFLVGDNGIGKSTFIEAIAVSLGLNREGGTQNFQFSTKNTVSELSNYIRVSTYNLAKTKFFFFF